MKRKIHLVSISSDIVEDSYAEGELRSTGCGLANEKVGETFDSIEEMIKYLAKTYGYSEDNKDYEVIGRGLLGTSKQVADHCSHQNGGWFEPTKSEVEAWRRGEQKLYTELVTARFLKV